MKNGAITSVAAAFCLCGAAHRKMTFRCSYGVFFRACLHNLPHNLYPLAPSVILPVLGSTTSQGRHAATR
ncbi:hypothetical protein BN1221_02459 [Brenneria goodwinii]|uniref:Uncharacterized protein n=1 Tax=Brenneria goodwinii TaxID=1109412 RepID=A0A0G4JVS2_9GAMM|nr:hypothetical protein BN1221_02459 [Brenneria goodwinii]